ncbi:putative cellobiose dehydrogenase [Mollisia scopiformis]|uniref:Putative cellobiose dehydrogenase n=1 Tax=Mollisia scopiformis TaxID=149040 RepID=A0A194XK54_MOLSC|nr:putative cellobiose dehydrogenase [Mollisia scopiformis]KUJ20172.1 putative cellobiose dehydrogenase [Mollisia scopiformis]
MKTSSFFSGVIGAAFCSFRAIVAQDFATHGIYTEPNTNITFFVSSEANGTITGDGEFSTVSWGGFTFGMALPPTAGKVDTHEYIGLIIGSTPTGKGGWTGIVHGDSQSAAMPNHLMLLAWPTGVDNQIATSFRYAPAYQPPTAYKGSANLTQIYSSVNASNWVLIYRCQNCFIFDDPSQTSFNTSTSKAAQFMQGWAQSFVAPVDPKNPQSNFDQHNNGMGEFAIQVASATHVSYSAWATKTATGVIATGTATATATFTPIPVPTQTTYDYIVVGAGAGGIPMADKLSAAGKSVLLIEKGVASSARWGGTIRSESHWMDGQNLTWFDIPGECNRIWNGGTAGVACTDIDQMAGCILGGGTAVNAGLWWKPNPSDWDVNFPAGWKSSDMAAATSRVFSRIPGTDHPSMDGVRYLQDGFNIITGGLEAANWTSVTANDHPASKNRTFCHPPHMFSHGERGGPMATYLVSAMNRRNFHLWLNTSVEKINRVGGHANSLNVIPTNDGGRLGTVSLTPGTGRLVLSAGTFGTPKLLFRSGIGPADQLQVVQGSVEGAAMINQTEWIHLPVGYNLNDHLNTDTVVSHPNVSYYDWPASWLTPIEADKENYFVNRSGPLAQAAPNIGPIMWEEIKGPDGIVRHMQWQARVEGSNGIPNGNSMTLSLYLGRGEVSRGRIAIQKGLNMIVDTIPYGDPNDLATVGMAIDNMVNNLKTIPNITWNLPPPGMSGADYLKTIPLTYANVGARRANHWMGTSKMGTDSGLVGNGTAVVDTNCKVYGTDNIFVSDGSIFPGQVTTNPSALIVTAAEHASYLILALPVTQGGGHHNGGRSD